MKQFLVLFSITILLFSCKFSPAVIEKGPVKEPNYRLHDIWALKQVDDVKVERDQLSAYLEFNLTTNKVYGNTGCNSLSGDLFVSGDSIKLLDLAMTEMLCVGFKNEQEYLNRLQNAMKYSLNGLELTLISNKSVLIFQKVD